MRFSASQQRAQPQFDRRRRLTAEIAVRVFDLAPSLAIVGVELIAQNREEPRVQVGTGLETIEGCPGFHNGLLNEVIGIVGVPGEGEGKRAKAWDRGKHLIAKLVRRPRAE
jgi:hypothetical protein